MCKSIVNLDVVLKRLYFSKSFNENNILWTGLEITDFMVKEGKNNIPIEKGDINNINYMITH